MSGGIYIPRGVNTRSLNRDYQWEFKPDKDLRVSGRLCRISCCGTQSRTSAPVTQYSIAITQCIICIAQYPIVIAQYLVAITQYIICIAQCLIVIAQSHTVGW